MALEDPELTRLFEFPEGRLPRDRLVNLVIGIQKLFCLLMEKKWADESDFSMIPPDFQPNLNQSLQKLTPHYEELINRIENLNYTVLMNHGLTEPQLNFKLQVINVSFRKFFHNPKKESLKTLMDAIDELLENLIGATGAGSPVEELIDTIKVALSIRK